MVLRLLRPCRTGTVLSGSYCLGGYQACTARPEDGAPPTRLTDTYRYILDDMGRPVMPVFWSLPHSSINACNSASVVPHIGVQAHATAYGPEDPRPLQSTQVPEPKPSADAFCQFPGPICRSV